MAKRAAKKRRRSAPPPPPIGPIQAFRDHFSWKWLVGFAGGVGAILGVVVAYKNAHPVLEPLAPSTRGYVREYSDDSTKSKLEPISKWMADYDAYRATQLFEAAKLNLTQLNQNLVLAKKDLAANPGSQFLQDAVQQLETQILDTRKRIESYEALSTKRK